jgi:hypothetical protein
MITKSWKEYFKEEIKGFENLNPGASLLYSAIKNRRIKSQEYLDWAKNNLELTTVRDNFFSKRPLSKNIYDQFKTFYKWNEECLPIYYWNDILYIGCLEVPAFFNQQAHVVFTLCSLESLESYWHQWQNFENNPTVSSEVSFSDLERTMVVASEPESETLNPINQSLKKLSENYSEAPEGLLSMRQYPPSVFDILGEDHKDQIDKATKALFGKMRLWFKKSMILKINGPTCTPWVWDENFHFTGKKIEAISLEEPSIFRIVWRATNAYHGYVVPNDLNEAFFDEWNQSVIPDHVTIVPIIIHDNTTGLLMGLGNKQAYNEKTLDATLELAQQLIESLLGSRSDEESA